MAASAPAPDKTDAPAAEAAAAGGLKAKLPMVLALVAGIAVGGGAGAFLVGPALAKGITPASVAAEAHKAEEEAAAAEEHKSEGGKEGEAAATTVYTIDNLVLNPAGSGGTRFLLLTLAFDLKDAATLEEMKARDAELRDVVIAALGAKTVEQLADMAARESLKGELRDVAAKMFPKKKAPVRRVYFPQFVIQ